MEIRRKQSLPEKIMFCLLVVHFPFPSLLSGILLVFPSLSFPCLRVFPSLSFPGLSPHLVLYVESVLHLQAVLQVGFLVSTVGEVQTDDLVHLAHLTLNGEGQSVTVKI